MPMIAALAPGTMDELDAADLAELRRDVDDDLPAASIDGNASLVIRKVPRTWIANIRSKSATSRFSNSA